MTFFSMTWELFLWLFLMPTNLRNTSRTYYIALISRNHNMPPHNAFFVYEVTCLRPYKSSWNYFLESLHLWQVLARALGGFWVCQRVKFYWYFQKLVWYLQSTKRRFLNFKADAKYSWGVHFPLPFLTYPWVCSEFMAIF